MTCVTTAAPCSRVTNRLGGTAMTWMASLCVLFFVSVSAAQQMDEKNDPALQLTFYTPHRISISKEKQGNAVLRDEWAVVPYIATRYDHTEKWLGIVVELHGNKQVLDTGAGGLMFTVDGKQVGVSPEILAHSHRQTSCALTRCTVMWNIGPKIPVEASALGEFVKTVANAHEVYVTLFPGDNGGAKRFTAQFTDEGLQAFRDTRQYYDSLTLVKKASVPAPVTQ
jgi:hypothetical protein